MHCLNRLWKQRNSIISSHFFGRALRDITKNSRELLFNVDPLTTINLASFIPPKWEGTGLSEWRTACNETVHSSQFSVRIFPEMLIHLAASVPLFTQPSSLLLNRLLWSQRPECKFLNPQGAVQLKPIACDLRDSWLTATESKSGFHRIYQHYTNYCCMRWISSVKSFICSGRYYVENSALFWRLFSVDVTIISRMPHPLKRT